MAGPGAREEDWKCAPLQLGALLGSVLPSTSEQPTPFLLKLLG